MAMGIRNNNKRKNNFEESKIILQKLKLTNRNSKLPQVNNKNYNFHNYNTVTIYINYRHKLNYVLIKFILLYTEYHSNTYKIQK